MHGIFASTGWADDARADDSSSSDYCYDHGHIISRGICGAAGLVYAGYTGLRAPIPGAYVYCPGYGPLADHQYCINSTYEDLRGVGIYGYPGAGLVGVGAVGGVSDRVVGNPEPSGRPDQRSLGGGLGAIPRCMSAATGGYGTRPTEVGTSGYYGYLSVPTGVALVDQVDGCVGWTGPATATGYRGPGGLAGQTAPDGRRAASNADTASRTPSVWAGVEPAKLYTGVGQSYMDAGAAGILHPAYPGQPIQLRPAAPIQLANGQFYQPLVLDSGPGTAPAPTWNHPAGSWVRAPQGPPTGAPSSAPTQGGETGFISEARGTRPPNGQSGVNQQDQASTSS